MGKSQSDCKGSDRRPLGKKKFKKIQNRVTNANSEQAQSPLLAVGTKDDVTIYPRNRARGIALARQVEYNDPIGISSYAE